MSTPPYAGNTQAMAQAVVNFQPIWLQQLQAATVSTTFPAVWTWVQANGFASNGQVSFLQTESDGFQAYVQSSVGVASKIHPMAMMMVAFMTLVTVLQANLAAATDPGDIAYWTDVLAIKQNGTFPTLAAAYYLK